MLRPFTLLFAIQLHTLFAKPLRVHNYLLQTVYCPTLEEADYFMHITPLLHHTLKYVFENIMKNGAFALLEQMLHFP